MVSHSNDVAPPTRRCGAGLMRSTVCESCDAGVASADANRQLSPEGA
jgi:hypothetical protein